MWHLPDIFQGPFKCSVAWVVRCSDLEEEPCGLKTTDPEKSGTVWVSLTRDVSLILMMDYGATICRMFFWHNSRIHVDAQGTLIIQGVAPEDAGNYSCQAANEVGTDEETITLYYTGTYLGHPVSGRTASSLLKDTQCL